MGEAIKENLCIYREKISLSLPGVFGMRIQPCTSKEENVLECGDSVLINFKRRVFAIADGPDWNPSSSKNFLMRFNARVDYSFDHYRYIDKNDINKLKIVLIKETNDLLRETDSRSSTTFSSLIIFPDFKGMKALMFHCGDSYVYRVNIKEKAILQMSHTNMHFVGRSNEISQVEFIGADQNDRFILCTDGHQVLSRNQDYENLELLLLDSITNNDISCVPDMLIDKYGGGLDLYDDISIVAINPDALS